LDESRRAIECASADPASLFTGRPDVTRLNGIVAVVALVAVVSQEVSQGSLSSLYFYFLSILYVYMATAYILGYDVQYGARKVCHRTVNYDSILRGLQS
jgi:hypothetical protein